MQSKKQHDLRPFIKWAGGKEREIKHIQHLFPEHFENYYEPFVGGGAIYFYFNKPSFINDKSDELVNLYKAIKIQDSAFFETLEIINNSWKTIHYHIISQWTKIICCYRDNNSDICTILHNLIKELNSISLYTKKQFSLEIKKSIQNKIVRMKVLEEKKGILSDNDVVENIEGAFKAGVYTYIRYLYNKISSINITEGEKIAIYYFIREYCYSGMFRYNKTGEFNVPYGGLSYNKKYLTNKINYLKSSGIKNLMNNTKISNDDFAFFLRKSQPTENDFVFLDPPYDTSFSTYAQNTFDKNDQIRLASYLYDAKFKWLMVIKNTEFIHNLYDAKNLNIYKFDKKYQVSFQNRNDKDVEHLIITNF